MNYINSSYFKGINKIFDLSEKIIKKWMMQLSNKNDHFLFGDSNKKIHHHPILLKYNNDRLIAFFLNIKKNKKIETIYENKQLICKPQLNEFKNLINKKPFEKILPIFEHSVKIVYDNIYNTMSNLNIFKNVFLLVDKDNFCFYPYKFHELELYKIGIEHELKNNSDINKKELEQKLLKINLLLEKKQFKKEIINNNKYWKNKNTITIQYIIFNKHQKKNILKYIDQLI